MNIAVKRVYEQPDEADGFRVLVDRLWPRGVSKDDAAIALWAKDAAPSTELRQWFDHDPARWTAFTERYQRELDGADAALEDLLSAARAAGADRLTLVYAARDPEQTHALVLAERLRTRAPG